MIRLLFDQLDAHLACFDALQVLALARENGLHENSTPARVIRYSRSASRVALLQWSRMRVLQRTAEGSSGTAAGKNRSPDFDLRTFARGSRQFQHSKTLV